MALTFRKRKPVNGTKDIATTSRPILPWVPILISLVAVFFTARTYYVALRPYVGVVNIDYQVSRNDKAEPAGMSWQFVMKNTGAAPAFVTVEKDFCQLIQGERSVILPVIGPPQGSILLMPNQTANITGGFSDTVGSAMVGQVLSGKALLTVDIGLSYRPIGWWWWRNTFVYRVKTRFRHDYVPPGFVMESGSAN
ncbi:MAG: hypothetical protein ABSD47_19505 [Candidatus Methylomirabilota bacterium]